MDGKEKIILYMLDDIEVTAVLLRKLKYYETADALLRPYNKFINREISLDELAESLPDNKGKH